MRILKNFVISTSLTLALLSSSVLAMEPDKEASTRRLRHIQPRPSYSELEEIHQIRHPSDFTGIQTVDLQIVQAHRQQLARLPIGTDDLPLAFHNPALSPLVDKLEGFIRTQAAHHPTSKQLSRILMEITFQRGTEDLNPLWLFNIHFRAAAALSKRGKGERDVFAHTPNPELYFGLLAHNTWHNNLSSYLGIMEFGNKGHDLRRGFLSCLPDQVCDDLYTNMQRILPGKIVYPCLEAGKFGISFLVRNLLRDVHPTAFPSQSLFGHGTRLSQYGCAVHDWLHSLADRRRDELMTFVVEQADWHYVNGGNIPDFMKVFPYVARAKYLTLMGSLHEIYMDMGAKLIPYRGITEFRRAMVGFFWSMHEKPNFPAKLYRMNDLDKVIETITTDESTPSAVSFSLEEYDLWESSFDPFETSPLNGQSPKNDDEICRWVLANMKIDQANCYKYLDCSSDYPIFQNDVVSRKVNRSKRFIDVIFSMRDGTELKYTFPTLYHKWKNMDDNLSLLRYGGTKIAKPALDKVNARDIAKKTLDLVRDRLDDHIEHFKTVASFFANYEPRGEGSSLAQRYFRQNMMLDAWAAKYLKKGAL